MATPLPPVPQASPMGFLDPVWQRWFLILRQRVAELGGDTTTLPVDFGAAIVSAAQLGEVQSQLSAVELSILSLPGNGAALAEFQKLSAILGEDAYFAKFSCNGKLPQAAFTLPAAATDLPTAIALVNALRSMAIANGIGQ